MREELQAAMRECRYVRITRRKGWVPTDGYVVAVARDWFAVVCVVDARFDGVAVMRVQDVRRVRDRRRQLLGKRVLRHLELWPPRVPELLDLHDARSVAFTAGSLCRVLSFAQEERRPGVFWVGSTHRITRNRIEVWEIGPDARWEDQVDVRLGALTKVVLWDPYVETITAIADAHEGNLWAQENSLPS